MCFRQWRPNDEHGHLEVHQLAGRTILVYSQAHMEQPIAYPRHTSRRFLSTTIMRIKQNEPITDLYQTKDKPLAAVAPHSTTLWLI